MRKNVMKIALAMIFSVAAIFYGGGCSSGGSDAKKISLKVYLLNKPSSEDADWGMWWWYDYKTTNGNDIAVSKGKGVWPTGADSFTESDEIGSYVVIEYDTSNPWLGLLFVDKNNGSDQSADIIVPLDEFESTKTLYCLYDNMTEYYTDITQTYGLISASITDGAANEISAKVYKIDSVSKDDVSINGNDGGEITVESVVLNGSDVTIKLADGDIKKTPYTVKIGNKSVIANLDNDLIDDVFKYDGNDLGLTLNGNTATFKTWSPFASDIQLLLFTETSSFATATKTVQMDFDKNSGVWSAENIDVSKYEYYQYAITVNKKTNKVCDIWAKAASADSVASQIADINDSAFTADWESEYVNPWASSSESKSYSEAVIYEMHIRDWSRAFVENSTGKFEDIASALGENGAGKFAEHLKDLGITHVQILPMFDYAQKNSDTNYNWGYNPYHYNVPEGRYVNNMQDGTDAVSQMRKMIKAFHDAGIAVNMDVVYNHTSGTGSGSLYDMTVPNYFYRQDENGKNTNGSGCGNEVATQRKMVKRYVIDSLKHWMNDYHINGFRFDLMGLHETDTMKEIYDELYKIDPNVMVYGEPWTGGSSPVENGTVKDVIDDCADSLNVNGVACFNDDIRDAIKGSVFSADGKGQVQGSFNDTAIATGLLGSTEENNGFTENPARSLNYVECHDNLTLFDKLAFSNFGKYKDLSEEQIKTISAQNKLAAAYIFLAQGTPFINGGQEFMRTKQGVDNSYQSSDSINGIDLSFKETYSDVYNVYKGLIALRKANPDAFGANKDATAETVSTGVTKYTTGDFCVYFNATDSDENIDSAGYSKVVEVISGTLSESSEMVSSVPAKSFVILKK